MEKLTLNKFEDSKLENLQTLKGGNCYTTLDGVEQGDLIVNEVFLIDADGDGWHETVGNPDTIEGAC